MYVKYIMSFKISNFKFKHRGVLAPILDYSTLPYRLLSKKYGASLTYTEMIHIKQIVSLEEQIEKINSLDSCIEDNITSVQLIGDFTNKKTFLKAISIIDDYKYFKIIDLNFGCPSGKIITGNAGAKLLDNIDLVLENIKEAKSICKKPITIKTRLGFTEKQINLNANKLISTGIDALAVHARTAIENYSVLADVSLLKKLNKDISIPLIYNGDVGFQDIEMFDEFQGLMVARRALGNPYIFSQINDYDKDLEIKEYTFDKRKKALNDFIKIYKEHKIPFTKLKIMVVAFFRDFPKSSVLRDSLSKCKSEEEVFTLIKEEVNK